MPPQNMLLWHDYFELIRLRKKERLEKIWKQQKLPFYILFEAPISLLSIKVSFGYLLSLVSSWGFCPYVLINFFLLICLLLQGSVG